MPSKKNLSFQSKLQAGTRKKLVVRPGCNASCSGVFHWHVLYSTTNLWCKYSLGLSRLVKAKHTTDVRMQHHLLYLPAQIEELFDAENSSTSAASVFVQIYFPPFLCYSFQPFYRAAYFVLYVRENETTSFCSHRGRRKRKGLSNI